MKYKNGLIMRLTKDVMRLENVCIPPELAGREVMILGRDGRGMFVSEALKLTEPKRNAWKIGHGKAGNYFMSVPGRWA